MGECGVGVVSGIKDFQFYFSVHCLVKTSPSSFFLCCQGRLESYPVLLQKFFRIFLNIEIYHSDL